MCHHVCSKITPLLCACTAWLSMSVSAETSIPGTDSISNSYVDNLLVALGSTTSDRERAVLYYDLSWHWGFTDTVQTTPLFL